MAAPTYRCPFKVDTTNDQGIICENVNCAFYYYSPGDTNLDSRLEHCTARLFLRKAVIGSIGKNYGGK